MKPVALTALSTADIDFAGLNASGAGVAPRRSRTHAAWRASTARIEPALNAESFFEDFFALAETGKTDRAGVPTPLRLAVLLADNPGFLFLEKPPVRVQKAIVRVLAPLGRALGYGRAHNAPAGGPP